MKRLFSLILFVLIYLTDFSQEPVLNIGFGFPVFFKSDFIEGGMIHQLTRKRIHLFTEIPINVGSEKKISVHPGIGYFLFNEKKESDPTALGGYSHMELQHNAISVFSRMFYHVNSNHKNFRQYYFGGIAGTYLWSKTEGESFWWLLTNPYSSGGKTYNQSGLDFFHYDYWGFTSGLKFRTNTNYKFDSSLELSVFPNFVTVENKKRTAAMLTVVLGIGQKKATRINE